MASTPHRPRGKTRVERHIGVLKQCYLSLIPGERGRLGQKWAKTLGGKNPVYQGTYDDFRDAIELVLKLRLDEMGIQNKLAVFQKKGWQGRRSLKDPDVMDLAFGARKEVTVKRGAFRRTVGSETVCFYDDRLVVDFEGRKVETFFPAWDPVRCFLWDDEKRKYLAVGQEEIFQRVGAEALHASNHRKKIAVRRTARLGEHSASIDQVEAAREALPAGPLFNVPAAREIESSPEAAKVLEYARAIEWLPVQRRTDAEIEIEEIDKRFTCAFELEKALEAGDPVGDEDRRWLKHYQRTSEYSSQYDIRTYFHLSPFDQTEGQETNDTPDQLDTWVKMIAGKGA